MTRINGFRQLPLPPVQDLADHFSYDPETGRLSYRKAVHNRGIAAGDEAGWADAQGYRRVKVGKATFAVHRICWAIHTGAANPVTHVVDHINGDRADNRAINLRLLSFAENSKNRLRNGGQGLPKGVRREGLWHSARVNVRGDMRRLGRFLTVREAAQAYDGAARIHLGPLCKTNEDLGLLPELTPEQIIAKAVVADWLAEAGSYEDLIAAIADVVGLK